MGALKVANSLDDLREEIDRIDAALHDLFVQRVEVVRRIGALKGARDDGRSAMRPAREAQVLRRLLARAGGARGGGRLPNAVLVRIWRELFAAMTRLQGPLAVAVYAPPNAPGYRDLARDHFGSFTPMTPVTRAGQAIHAVGTGAATVAVLPLPEDGGDGGAAGGEETPWWLTLFQGGADRLRVIAQLPFGAPGSGHAAEVRALAVGRFEHEPSGDDATVLAIEAEAGLSRGRLGALLKAADLPPGWSAVWRPPGSQGAPVFHVVEVGGFVAEGDERLGRLTQAARDEVLRAVPAGGYARPLTPEELA